MGPINTVSGGYSGRLKWAEPIKVQVSETGTFEIGGLNPSEYSIFVTAKGHIEQYQRVKLTAGERKDCDSVRLFSADFSFYVGKPAPQTEPLVWEADFETALKRATAENRPLMVMLTATWCGPCKMLEDQTLSDPWIRHFLSPYVVVKAYEDRAVEARYKMGTSYPTLVFTDSKGEMVHNSMGFMPPHQFVVQCARALRGTPLPLPPEIETLVEKKVIRLP
jgi:thiol-disulfide isomerase/thioredoxin